MTWLVSSLACLCVWKCGMSCQYYIDTIIEKLHIIIIFIYNCNYIHYLYYYIIYIIMLGCFRHISGLLQHLTANEAWYDRIHVHFIITAAKRFLVHSESSYEDMKNLMAWWSTNGKMLIAILLRAVLIWLSTYTTLVTTNSDSVLIEPWNISHVILDSPLTWNVSAVGELRELLQLDSFQVHQYEVLQGDPTSTCVLYHIFCCFPVDRNYCIWMHSVVLVTTAW